jgi:hypothetical protein
LIFSPSYTGSSKTKINTKMFIFIIIIYRWLKKKINT